MRYVDAMPDGSAVELDYAFPAEWAKVNPDGTLTSINASFLHFVSPLGAPMQFAVAARLRFTGACTDCDLRIELRAPDGSTMTFKDHIEAANAPTYGDPPRRHVLTVLNTGFIIQAYGMVNIKIFLNDSLVRTLMFDISTPPTQAEHQATR